MIGAAGFVGRAAADRLASFGEVVRVGRDDVDLAAPGADVVLARLLHPHDTCVFAAARAPCKTPSMLSENTAMGANISAALLAAKVDHVVYVSSDAVYADSDRPLTEDSVRAPESLHGVMHLSRELMLQQTLKQDALAILRPTLIYGSADPHGGYGPNQFRRLAANGKDIVLFGEGEERRDHVFVDDVAEIIALVVSHRSAGSLNVASGATHSFRDIAEEVAHLHGDKIAIVGTRRTGPMPHRGYRPFDISAVRAAFPAFQPTSLSAGLRRVHEESKGNG